jgi:hypothetical protein
VTDSEAESLSKYSTQSPRQSIDNARFTSDLDLNGVGSRRPRRLSSHNILDELPPITRSLSSSKIASHPHSILNSSNNNQNISSSPNEEALRSPTFSGTASIASEILSNNRPKHSLNKSYRKSLKQQLQTKHMPPSGSSSNDLMSPHATAKAFTRLVARSRAFFNVRHVFYDIYQWKKNVHSVFVCFIWTSLCKLIIKNLYMIIFLTHIYIPKGLYPRTVFLLAPPLLIVLLYSQAGIQTQQPSSQILLPRYDDSTAEYYTNLEDIQQSFLFLIRFYDNLAYHLQHITLDSFTYKVLFMTSLVFSVLLYYFARYFVLAIGLMILLNRTWVGNVIEVALQFLMEVTQTSVDVFHKLTRSSSSSGVVDRKPIQVSVYENQRWWAGNGYTSQVKT